MDRTAPSGTRGWKEIVVDVYGRHAEYNIAKVKRAFVPLPIRWTELLSPGVPRIGSAEMTAAVKAKLDGMFRRGTFKIFVMPDTSDHNVLPTKFVYSIKHEDGREVYKARFVLGGHRDKHKNHQIHNALHCPTRACASCLQLLQYLAGMFGRRT
jgi:hypothetical protein